MPSATRNHARAPVAAERHGAQAATGLVQRDGGATVDVGEIQLAGHAVVPREAQRLRGEAATGNVG
jgi:hypothetical protein